MSKISSCKGCTGSVSVEKQPHVFFTDDSLLEKEELLRRKRRLEFCTKCEFLQYGTTCGQSGMLVSYRAGLIEAKCPHPAETKW
ncbi:hypothetical protein NLX67_13920 [Domibacillus sp. A3M-37]|uniref:hypothetical protein n=1 Tax=Domibacillus TaxID=1433999 RepID=UPI000617F3D6|nr:MULTISPECIES: hypothetical protein [Domibacillus]MCP3763481.1 hypothetical protein [Domibacillus sp. A3M-37]